jgi:hypothetical protein
VTHRQRKLILFLAAHLGEQGFEVFLSGFLADFFEDTSHKQKLILDVHVRVAAGLISANEFIV